MNKKQLFNELKNVDNDTNIIYWILDNLINDDDLKSYVINERVVLNE